MPYSTPAGDLLIRETLHDEANNLSGSRFAHLGVRVRFPRHRNRSVATLRHHIRRIFSDRSQEKVIGVGALRVVASMADKQRSGVNIVVEIVADPMCPELCPRPRNTDSPISLVANGISPLCLPFHHAGMSLITMTIVRRFLANCPRQNGHKRHGKSAQTHKTRHKITCLSLCLS